MMLKALGGFPRWLTVVLALVAAAALWVIPYLTVSLHGWKLALSIVFGAIFTVLAVGLPQLQQWQSKQESRLQVEVVAEPSVPTIPKYVDADGVIDTWLRAEEVECLSSLPPRQQGRRLRDFDTEVLDRDKASGSSDESLVKNITFRDLQRIEEKKKSGEELTVEEEQALTAVQAKITPIIKVFSSAFSAQMLSDPDQRTVEKYRSEVGQHLIRYREFLDEWLIWEYAKSGIGRLKIILVNPTGKVYEGVQVEVYLPGMVKAMVPDEIDEPADFPPSRPRAFGTRVPKSLMAFSPYLSTPVRSLIPRRPRSGPMIDNSASARVVYRPVTLRPYARMVFDDIALTIQEPSGHVIEGTWEATATNAEGRMLGRLSVKVDIANLPVRELLGDLFNRLSR